MLFLKSKTVAAPCSTYRIAHINTKIKDDDFYRIKRYTYNSYIILRTNNNVTRFLHICVCVCMYELNYKLSPVFLVARAQTEEKKRKLKEKFGEQSAQTSENNTAQ